MVAAIHQVTDYQFIIMQVQASHASDVQPVASYGVEELRIHMHSLLHCEKDRDLHN